MMGEAYSEEQTGEHVIESFVVDKDHADLFIPLLNEAAIAGLERPDTCLVGAVLDGEAAGAALFSVDEEHRGCGQILHLAVENEMRRMGVGTSLLNRCLRSLRQFAVTAMDCVLIGEETEGDEDGDGKGDLEEFLSAWGMERKFVGVVGVFTLDEALAGGRLSVHESEYCQSLAEVEQPILNRCSTELVDSDGWKQLDPELSYVYVKDRVIHATFLMQQRFDRLYVEWMANEEGGNPKALISLMEHSLAAARERYPGSTEVMYSAWNDTAKKLIRYVLAGQGRERKVRLFSLSDEMFRLKEVDL